MPRKIKFRAWDKALIRMKEVSGISWVNGEIDGVCFDREELVDAATVELMQYTGRKDKNGTEIYEGDIVTACWHSYEEPETKTIGKVIFNKGWLAHCIWNEEEKIMSEMNGQGYYTWEIEVIGNIYKNPELLIRKYNV